MNSTAEEQPRALLVSVVTPDISDDDARDSLAELERLVTTLGFKVVAKESQRQNTQSGATAVGSGKLKELTELIQNQDAGVISVAIFDCELRPSQLRNIENNLGIEVLDRTGVIIEIFSRHAKTRAARLQVEIARLNYLSPRLRETGSSGERQAGRGSGESALETGRRGVRDRLAELKRDLQAVQTEQANHRRQRAEQLSVALVGYTNAGKSSTMRALTGSDVLVEDKLFATLDTTVRAIKPETHPRILISDTVGFIKKLPHDLVASFQSTLDEAANASLLLYVVDAADSTFRAQLEVVENVLREVGVQNTPHLLVLNKSDQLDTDTQKRLRRELPKALLVSTRNTEDIAKLRDAIVDFFEREMKEDQLFVPFQAKNVVGDIHANTRVLHEAHDENGTTYTIRARATDIERINKKIRNG